MDFAIEKSCRSNWGQSVLNKGDFSAKQIFGGEGDINCLTEWPLSWSLGVIEEPIVGPKLVLFLHSYTKHINIPT